MVYCLPMDEGRKEPGDLPDMTMNDQFDSRIDRNGSLWAGYHICRLHGGPFESFLFETLRLNRVLNGSAEWQIGKNVYTIKKGDIIAVNNLEARRFLRVPPGETLELEVFSFSPALFGGELSCLRLFYNRTPDFDPVVSHSLSPDTRVPFLLDCLRDAFLSLPGEQTAQEKADVPAKYTPSPDTVSAQITGLLTGTCAVLLGEVERAHPETLGRFEKAGIDVPEMIGRTFGYISENIAVPFTVSDLAANVFLSRGYFSELFRRYLGETPAEFVTRFRIGNALRLLGTGNYTVLDAADASGFGSSSGFYRAFHTLYGQSPKVVLRNLGNTY